MTKATFLDANILVAVSNEKAPFHGECTHLMERLHQTRKPLFISRQVLREIAATLSRPQAWSPGIPAEPLAEQMTRLMKLYRIAEESADSTNHLLSFIRDGRARGRQVHDANIVAVMLANGIKRLATLNGRDFARFSVEIDVVSVDGRKSGGLA